MFEQHDRWDVIERLTVTISAEVKTTRIKVKDLFNLRVGQVVGSEWPETEDVPIQAGGVVIGWSEFEVAEQQLMIRLTRLA
jgi:flagellar motor switch/type III secretory pathway protein FliN